MSSISIKQRKEWEFEIKRDYPNINQWMLNILMDVYCADGGKAKYDMIVKNMIRDEKKGKQPKKEPIKAEIFNQTAISDWNDEWEQKTREMNEKVGAKVLPNPEIKSSVEIEDVNPLQQLSVCDSEPL